MATVRFEKVELYAAKSGKCPACGKTATRRGEFYQTLNPHNRNAKGQPKQGWEIVAELRTAIAQWRLEPVYHLKCES